MCTKFECGVARIISQKCLEYVQDCMRDEGLRKVRLSSGQVVTLSCFYCPSCRELLNMYDLGEQSCPGCGECGYCADFDLGSRYCIKCTKEKA